MFIFRLNTESKFQVDDINYQIRERNLYEKVSFHNNP